MFTERIPKITLCCLLFIHIQASGYTVGYSQDQTSPRTNTLFDDADDIQRQLDNEARDRIKFGRPKTIWVFHFPTHFPEHKVPIEEELSRCPRQDTTSDEILPDEDEDEAQPAVHKIKLTTNTCKKTKVEEEEPESYLTPPLPTDGNGNFRQTTFGWTDIEAPFREWDYSNQQSWGKLFPECGGKSQSPVDLPISGLIRARGARKLLFQNYDVLPKSMTLMNDGRRVVLFGEWRSEQRPLIYGGAAHSRRYLFHSLTIHLPSEHTVGGLQYPLESQAFFISAEYRSIDEAMEASPSDPQAFLSVANLYKYANHSHKGIEDILSAAKNMGIRNGSIAARCLSHFNPPFKEYACYQGAMTTPPCTESVLWLVRGRTLSIGRDTVEAAQTLLASDTEPRHLFFRNPQPLNDRKVFLFK